MKLSRAVLFIFYLFVFFLPHTKLSVPVILQYEFTFSDLLLILLFFLSILRIRRLSKKLSIYLVVFVLFLFGLMCSIPFAKSTKYFISDLVPYAFSFMILTTILTFISNVENKLKILSSLYYLMFSTFLLTNIPVYYQIITGNKLLQYYDNYGWRYSFLCQNPNQFGVFVILFSFLLILMALKYFPKRFKWLSLSLVMFIPTALYSGSKTVAIVFSMNLILSLSLFFLRASWRQKATIIPIVLFLIITNASTLLEMATKNAGQAGRALSAFELIDKKNRKDGIVGGDSGDSMNEALNLFSSYPITGVGLANKPMYSSVTTEIHNTFLKVLAESGLIGFFGFILILLLPLVALIFSNSAFVVKFSGVLFYLLFAAMNWPHMLFRQRWVWFFMIMFYIIARVDRKGELSKSRLKFLN